MTEIREGIRGILARPAVYDLFQGLVGAYGWRAKVVKELISPRIKAGTRVMDIGCGTCDILRHLPENIDYHGYDRNGAYIESARRRFAGRRAIFECRSVGDDDALGIPAFDVVLAFGLMHHLEDGEVSSLLRTAKKLLVPGGVLFLLDPVFTAEQSGLAKFIISKDRGRNVRTADAYLSLCDREFDHVKRQIDDRPLLIPYTGIVITCSMAPFEACQEVSR
jgi:SAM-dependent methyltransferase